MTVDRSPEATYALAVERLRQRLLSVRPCTILDTSGYCLSTADNLIDGVSLPDVAAEFDAGAGRELGGKFLAPHSSSALAVNTFAPVRAADGSAELLGRRLPVIAFEAKQPTGLPGTPPHLDVLTGDAREVIAIESKCLEPICTRVPAFRPSYRRLAPERADTAWFAEMVRITEAGPHDYRHLDAAQLIKHALGLHANANGRSVTLLYLFWEPADVENWPVFAAHRAELDAFTARVAGDAVALAAMSYRELWSAWAASSDPTLLRVAGLLRARYAVRLD